MNHRLLKLGMPLLPYDHNLTNERGFSLLLAVLVFGTVGAAIALYLLTTGSQSYTASDILKKSYQAQGLANACVEVAVHSLSGCTTTLSSTITIDKNSCSYLIEQHDPGATITSQAVVDTIIRRVKVEVVSASPTIKIGSWQEVGL